MAKKILSRSSLVWIMISNLIVVHVDIVFLESHYDRLYPTVTHSHLDETNRRRRKWRKESVFEGKSALNIESPESLNDDLIEKADRLRFLISFCHLAVVWSE